MSKILDLITGFLPGKQGDGNFFLELKEDVEDKVGEIKDNVGDKVSEIKDNVGDKVSDALPTDTLNNKTITQQVSNGTQAKAQASSSTEVKTENGKVNSSSKSENKSKKVSIKERRKQEKSEVTAQPTSVPTTAKPKQPLEPQETAFASKYLLPNTRKPRRRPGPNMDSFLEMARDVKPPMKK